MECEATLDRHNDKVWALDVSPDGMTMVSGGADSQILVWTDTTRHEEEVQREQEEKDVLMEQKLANHLRRKEWALALSVCLDMDKPRQTLKVFTAIVEDALERSNENTLPSKAISNPGLDALQKQVESWPMSKTTQVLRYCREWNTRALNSHLAMLVFQAIVTTIPARQLAVAEGVPEILAGITPYAERHFARIDRLVTSSHLLQYTLLCMGDLEQTNETSDDYANWETTSKLVLPPKQSDGRIQVGGRTVVGKALKSNADDEDVQSIGDSDSSSSEENDEDESRGRKVKSSRLMELEDEIDEHRVGSDQDERSMSSDESSNDDDA
jgi:U3 small nucleolar RNA-associated protein 13